MKNIIIALLLLFAVVFVIKYISHIRRKKRIQDYRNKRKLYRKKNINIAVNNGLKCFQFEKTGVFPAFKCFALNENNARRKYKNFITQLIFNN